MCYYTHRCHFNPNSSTSVSTTQILYCKFSDRNKKMEIYNIMYILIQQLHYILYLTQIFNLKFSPSLRRIGSVCCPTFSDLKLSFA